jgi:hypothetical protein
MDLLGGIDNQHNLVTPNTLYLMRGPIFTLTKRRTVWGLSTHRTFCERFPITIGTLKAKVDKNC